MSKRSRARRLRQTKREALTTWSAWPYGPRLPTALEKTALGALCNAQTEHSRRDIRANRRATKARLRLTTAWNTRDALDGNRRSTASKRERTRGQPPSTMRHR